MSAVRRYRHRDGSEVEAAQLTVGAKWEQVAMWCGGDLRGVEGGRRLLLADGSGEAHTGQWVVRERGGEFRVVDLTAFYGEFTVVVEGAVA